MIRLLTFAIASVLSLSAHSDSPPVSGAQAAAVDAGGSLIQVAEIQTTDPLSAASIEFTDLSIEEATNITQGYMSQLTSTGMDGQTVYDISTLPDSKSKITASLLKLMEATSDHEATSNFKTGILVLAFFQPGVGATAVSLEQMGPGQQTWKETVDSEMKTLSAALTQRGY